MKSLVAKFFAFTICLGHLAMAQSVYTQSSPTSATAYPNIQAAVTAAGSTQSVTIPASYQSSATISGFSITSNIVTFTASNSLQAGQAVIISGLSTGTYLNGASLTVLSSGLSSSQFQANFTHANVSSTSDSGIAACCSDTFTNSQHIRVSDLRPYNPTNTSSYSRPPQPQTTIKAAEFGAKCDGTADDWPAINAAVNALAVLAGGIAGSSLVPAAVELPQGTCKISQPIVLRNYGSLQGSKNGTWLSMYGTFTSSSAMVQVEMDYGFSQQNISTIGRYVKDINFAASWNTPTYDITGISVYNQTGSSSSYPYPYQAGGGVNWQKYQIPGLTISGNSFFAMDTGIDIEDCNNCDVNNNQFNFVRRGIVQAGNVFILNVHDNYIQQGSDTYSHTGGTTFGEIIPSSEVRWICTSPSPCAAAQSVISSPQGCNFNHNQVAGFDTDLSVANCLGGEVLANGFDYGGSVNTGTINSTIAIGANVVWFQFAYNFMAQSQCSANVVEVGAPSSAPSDASAYYQGLWLNDNWIQSYCTTGQQAGGINFDAGSYPRRNVYIRDNQFYDLGYGVIMGHPLQYSVIDGNYAFKLNYAVLAFNVSGGGNFQGSTFSNNTTPDAKLVLDYINPASYQQVGFNMGGPQSGPTQLTGTQQVSTTGCTISSGSIGNTCSSAVTVTLPTAFADSSYHVSCGGQGGSGVWTTTTPNIINGGSFSVNETALTATATGGGAIVCQATHN